MELFAKIFVSILIMGLGIMGCYCAYEINRIRAKWEREGVNEKELFKDFFNRND